MQAGEVDAAAAAEALVPPTDGGEMEEVADGADAAKFSVECSGGGDRNVGPPPVPQPVSSEADCGDSECMDV